MELIDFSETQRAPVSHKDLSVLPLHIVQFFLILWKERDSSFVCGKRDEKRVLAYEQGLRIGRHLAVGI